MTNSHFTITDAGGGGVLLTSARFSYMDDSKLFTPGALAAKAIGFEAHPEQHGHERFLFEA